MGTDGQPLRIGKYHLVEEIHRGPSASVYRGEDPESGEPVAVKLFHARYRIDPRFAIRFRRQFQALSALSHTNLVSIRDYGVQEGRYFCVTAWVEGVDLGAYLVDHGTLLPWWAANVARQVCRALGTIHQAGMIHRGIKPGNILLTAEGEVKVADVGQSSLISETGLSRTNVMVGGVGYISPEQARGGPATPVSDLYSLGIVLYEMLTGRLPFTSPDAWTMVRLHAEEAPPSPRRLAPHVPEDLAQVVLRSLEKDPVQRYSSAGDFEAALTAVLEGGSLSHGAAQAEAAVGSPQGWLSSSRLRDSWKALNVMLVMRVPLGLSGVSPPFGFLLAFQFLLSFILALAVLYGLVLLIR